MTDSATAEAQPAAPETKKKKTPKAKPEVVGVPETTNVPTPHPIVAIRRAGVPLVAMESADPAATIRSCIKAIGDEAKIVLEWDVNRGLRGSTGSGLSSENRKLSATVAASIGEPLKTANPAQCLTLILNNYKPEEDNGALFFFHAGNRIIENWTVAQAVWNLRDMFKACGATLILLGPSFKLPAEIASDVFLFEEKVPTVEQITAQITTTAESAKIAVPEGETLDRVKDTLTGYLSVFAIEQALAFSVTKSGFNTRRLWDLKVSALKSTAGLEVSQPEFSFDDLAGCHGAKVFLRRLIAGRQRFRGVFFLDEIEKMVAGNGGDLSGTTQALVEQWLHWTEAKKVNAILLIGIPGGGKSHTAACVAGEAKVPLLRGSMSTVKGSLVGSSEANMKTLLKTVDSVTGEQTLMIATCNSLESLTPEMLARFKLGVFFYDYPTKEEAAALWAQYRKKYELADPIPDNVKNWVGREIESCCHRAWMFRCSLKEAAESVVPVFRANKEKMTLLRQSASGRFLSASRPGVFEEDETASSSTDRKFN